MPSEEVPELSRLLARMVRELGDEIRSQRDLALAESHDLPVHWEPVNSRDILTGVIETLRKLEAARDREILLHLASAEVTFPSDKSLLARVLGNMLKNALEAATPGRLVTVGCHANTEKVDFWVHNDGAMPRDVQLQVFQRSFSTKGTGRGLGTYSIKLLSAALSQRPGLLHLCARSRYDLHGQLPANPRARDLSRATRALSSPRLVGSEYAPKPH